MPPVEGGSAQSNNAENPSQPQNLRYVVRPFEIRWHRADSPGVKSLFHRLPPPSARNKVRCLRWKKNGSSYLAMRMPSPPPLRPGDREAQSTSHDIEGKYYQLWLSVKRSAYYSHIFRSFGQKSVVLGQKAADRLMAQVIADATDHDLEKTIMETYHLPQSAEGLGARTLMSVMTGLQRAQNEKLAQDYNFWDSASPSLIRITGSDQKRNDNAAAWNADWAADRGILDQTGKTAGEWFTQQNRELTGDHVDAAEESKEADEAGQSETDQSDFTPILDHKPTATTWEEQLGLGSGGSTADAYQYGVYQKPDGSWGFKPSGTTLYPAKSATDGKGGNTTTTTTTTTEEDEEEEDEDEQEEVEEEEEGMTNPTAELYGAVSAIDYLLDAMAGGIQASAQQKAIGVAVGGGVSDPSPDSSDKGSGMPATQYGWHLAQIAVTSGSGGNVDARDIERYVPEVTASLLNWIAVKVHGGVLDPPETSDPSIGSAIGIASRTPQKFAPQPPKSRIVVISRPIAS